MTFSQTVTDNLIACPQGFICQVSQNAGIDVFHGAILTIVFCASVMFGLITAATIIAAAIDRQTAYFEMADQQDALDDPT